MLTAAIQVYCEWRNHDLKHSFLPLGSSKYYCPNSPLYICGYAEEQDAFTLLVSGAKFDFTQLVFLF